MIDSVPDLVLRAPEDFEDAVFNYLTGPPRFPELELSGVGFVGGLQGTGDIDESYDAVRAYAARHFPEATEAMLQPGALALVTVRALPTSIRPGLGRFDVEVRCNGNAVSLAGGHLVATRLFAETLDNLEPWAVASGEIDTAALDQGQRRAVLSDCGVLVTESGSSLDAARLNIARAQLRVANLDLAAAILQALNARFPDCARLRTGAYFDLALPAQFADRREVFLDEALMTRFQVSGLRQGMILVDVAARRVTIVGRAVKFKPGAQIFSKPDADDRVAFVVRGLEREDAVEIAFRREVRPGETDLNRRFHPGERVRTSRELEAVLRALDQLGADADRLFWFLETASTTGAINADYLAD